MNNILSILECCSHPKINVNNETLIHQSSTKKITERPKANKLFENKTNENKLKIKKENPFENNNETRASNELISPRFIEDGKYEMSSKLSYKSKDNNLNISSSFISFSNFPIQMSPPIEKDNKGVIGPKLLLSGELFYGKEIIISCDGMINGLRNKKDSQTFFGLNDSVDYKGTFYNDFVINYIMENDNDNLMKKKKFSTGRVFNISFHKNTKDYNLYMIHDSLIIYYEINDFVYFKNDRDYYLLLGNIFITIITKKTNNLKGIEIEIENEENKNQIYTFIENECPITIGRTNCKITIPKPSISKVHGIIDFSKECNMFYYKDTGSTNGSILLVKEDDYLKLKGEMNFKLENIAFKIMELP